MGPLVLKAQNILLKKHLQRQASRLGLHFDEFMESSQTAPLVLVAELEEPGVLEEISSWKEKWPECFVAISVTEPDKELWIAAETAGADLVANRGALPRLVYDRLKLLQQGSMLVKNKVLEKAKPVMNQGDGLIGRLPDSTEDPIAVFKWKDKVCAVRDICLVKLLSKLNRNDHLKLGNSRMEVFMIYIWQAIGKLNPGEIVQLCSSHS